jgi:hypothetical protein
MIMKHIIACGDGSLIVDGVVYRPEPVEPEAPRGAALFDALTVGSVFRFDDESYTVLAKAMDLIVTPVSLAPVKPLRERVTLGCRLRQPDGTVTEPVAGLDKDYCWDDDGEPIVRWHHDDGWEIAEEDLP